MFRYAFFIFIATIVCQGWCETEGIDNEILAGELPNGLQYYIRENHYPPERAALRLVVKVGSIHETEKERGVAHFLEHLSFRGSRHFADGEIVRYLESIGAWFGPDTNAMTSLESTTYILEIPLDQEETLDKALLALRDFAGNALLSDETIAKERHVVLDELHQTLSSAQYRLLKKSLETFLPESPLAHSLPIGTQEVVSQIEPAALRSFYKRWYRADRMAVVAVGDFDANEIQSRIERLFSDVPPSDEALLDPSCGEIFNEEPKILIHYDSDLFFTQVALNTYFPTPARKDDLNQLIRELVLSGIVHACLENEFSRFLESGLSLGAFAYEDDFLLKGLSCCHSISYLLTVSAEEGMHALSRFLESLRLNGFEMDDFRSAQDAVIEMILEQKQNLDHTDHSDFAESCIDHFLTGEPILSEEWAANECERIARSLTLEECNGHFAKMHFGKNAHILFATSDPEVHERISPDLLAALFRSEAEEDAAELPKAKRELSYKEPNAEGTVEEIKVQGSVLEWTLGNQMKVYAKQTDLEHDRVTLFLQSGKGLAHVPETEYGSAKLLPNYFWESGLSGLSASEFDSYIKSLGIECSISISLNQTAISLSSSREHLETAFQIAHDFFHPFSFDHSKWAMILNRGKEVQKQIKSNPHGAFYLDAIKINTQDHYLFRPIDFDAVDSETAESLASFFFGTPQDFSAILVGDFDQRSAEHLTKRYLASLPLKSREEVERPVFSGCFPAKTIEKDFAAGNQTYEQVNITFPFEDEASFFSSRAATKLLEQRLLDRLRWQAGGTYGVGVRIYRPFVPFSDGAAINISFTCQASERASLIQSVFEEIERVKNEPCSQDEMDGLKELLLKDTEMEKLSNAYWISKISSRLQQGIPLDSIGNEEIKIGNLNPETLQKTLQEFFASPSHSILTHVPRPNKEG